MVDTGLWQKTAHHNLPCVSATAWTGWYFLYSRTHPSIWCVFFVIFECHFSITCQLWGRAGQETATACLPCHHGCSGRLADWSVGWADIFHSNACRRSGSRWCSLIKKWIFMLHYSTDRSIDVCGTGKEVCYGILDIGMMCSGWCGGETSWRRISYITRICIDDDYLVRCRSSVDCIPWSPLVLVEQLHILFILLTYAEQRQFICRIRSAFGQ